MSDRNALTFADLLRLYRREAGISQETLAEQSGLSAKAIGALESGRRRAPYRATVEAIGLALGIDETAQAAFDAAAARARLRVGSSKIASVGFRDNLPAQVTSFVGREREIEDISRLLKQHRLLTVAGGGGFGKTRLAVESAFRIKDAFADGVWFVELANSSDLPSILANISASVGVKQSSGDVAGLVTQLSSLNVLIVIDNCEHVLDHVSEVVNAILRGSDAVSVMTTSRERLSLSGEVVYRIPSLPIPPIGGKLTATEAQAYAAVELFIDRAQMADPRFEISDESAAVVAEICRKLEGIALAIEIAAARLPFFGLHMLRRKLDDRLDPLTNSFVDSPARQRTIQAMLEWSYVLLTESERAFFRRLSVFRGSWTAEAAHAVCSSADADPSSASAHLSSLVDKSLIFIHESQQSLRFSFLESTRDFASERLHESGDSAETLNRFIEWAATIADQYRPSRYRLSEQLRLQMSASELHNTHAAFGLALEGDRNLVAAARIFGGTEIWDKIGQTESIRIADYLLARLGEAAHSKVVGYLYIVKAIFSIGPERLKALLTARDILTRSRNALGLVQCYFSLTKYYLATIADETSTASRTLGYAWTFAVLADVANSHVKAYVHYYRAGILERQGDIRRAREMFWNGAQAARSIGDAALEVRMRGPAAELYFCEGEVRRALSIFEELLGGASGYLAEPRTFYTYLHVKMAACHVFLGDLEAARKSADIGLRGADGFLVFTLSLIETLALIKSRIGRLDVAAQLTGCANRQRAIASLPREVFEQTCHDEIMTDLRKKLTDEEVRLHQSEGEALNLEQAVVVATHD